MAKLAALAAALLLYPPSALAWGGLGHEAIFELAFCELGDTARQRVIALIRQDEEFPEAPSVVRVFHVLLDALPRPKDLGQMEGARVRSA